MWTDLNINFQKKTFQHCCKQVHQPISLIEIDKLKADVFDFHERNVRNRKISIDHNMLPPDCQWCISTAPNNIKKVWNIWEDEDLDEYQKTNDLATLKKTSRTAYIDLDIGNSCDLACVYCGPWSSTTWAKELGQIKSARNFIDPEWKEKILENLSLYLLKLDSTEKIVFNILGGEPLLIVDTYEIISYLSNNCKHFKQKPILMITTNLNCKPASLKKLLETLEETKDIFEWNISVSIEDINIRAEQVRYHLDFNKFENNLKAIKNAPDKIYVTATLSIFSFPNFHEFINWIFWVLGVENYNKTWDFTLNNVQEGFTDLAYCPRELIDIDKIKNTYNTLIKDITDRNEHKVRNVMDHLDNMYQRSGTKKPGREFYGFWDKMSKRRNVDYFTIYPLTSMKFPCNLEDNKLVTNDQIS